MSRKSRRKEARSQLVKAMKSYVEFPWDYSYIPWQDLRMSVEQEGAGQLQQPIQKDVNRGDVPVDTRGGSESGSQPVSPELGRMPSALDTKLSPEESAAFEPERLALNGKP